MSLARRLLIANRGEIAWRIARTARRLGIETVAVHSDADVAAPHVRACDQAQRIGPAPATESYLRFDAILDAARRSGADAIHPGYGFLSENAAFAAACVAQGLQFVGPPAEAIRAMGSKSEAKALMARAGVPVVPGYHGESQDLATLQSAADAIGYPVLIKAVAGGGGKGMRRVEREAEFAAALEACRREAAASFGDERVLLERYVLRPRHVEIQVFADTQGGIVHLFERDCSVQRRHQKLLEEAPAPGMTPERRAAMGRAAIEAARAVGYVGAGTVEFLLTPDGEFFFMEMNTRLQVEHPVTEMITGLDLVEWQLRVAAGEPLPLTQQALRLEGHAIEARIYAEDPERGFLPSTGVIAHLGFPAASAEVRVDSGVVEGDVVTPYYDPMLAKLIVHGRDRAAALALQRQALAQCRIAGIASNVDFLRRLVASRAFDAAELDTALLEREHDALFPPSEPPPREAWLAAAAAASLRREPRIEPAHAPDRGARGSGRRAPDGEGWTSPWARLDGWRLAGAANRELELRSESWSRRVGLRWCASGLRLELEDTPGVAAARWLDATTLELETDGQHQSLVVVEVGSAWQVFAAGGRVAFEVIDPLAPRSGVGLRESHLRAPMPGRVVRLVAEPGEVERGAPLLVLEAMKMEHTLLAPAAGVLEAFHVAAGEQVAEGDELVSFQPAPAPN